LFNTKSLNVQQWTTTWNNKLTHNHYQLHLNIHPEQDPNAGNRHIAIHLSRVEV